MQKTVAYPKILHLGDKPIADLFTKEVEITEKIDGSQFGFGTRENTLICRSKGREIDLNSPDKMFTEAIAYVKSISDRLPDGIFFYSEYLQKPRHSTLAYDRIPKNHLVLFGVLHEDGTLAPYDEIRDWADRLDVVPLLYNGLCTPQEAIALVDTQMSYLGGQNIEGIVVKRYEQWLFLGDILTPVKAGKYVSEKFKETHIRDWSRLNTTKGSLERLKEAVRTDARWNKAIQHLRESGTFEGTVRDIGGLIKEIQHDIAEEEKENLKDQLWEIYSSDLLRSSVYGFVDWYKARIANGDFQA